MKNVHTYQLKQEGAEYLQKLGEIIYKDNQLEIASLIKAKTEAGLLEFYGLQSVYESYDKDLGQTKIKKMMSELYGEHKITNFFNEQNKRFKINTEV